MNIDKEREAVLKRFLTADGFILAYDIPHIVSSLSALDEQKAWPSDEEIESLALAHGINKSEEHWGVRYYTELGSNLFSFARALLSKYAAPVNEQDDTYTDENGTVLTRPTAWAYAQVCKARDKWQAKAEQDAKDAEREAAAKGRCDAFLEAIQIVRKAKENICAGGFAENAQYERSRVEPYLDGIWDEIGALYDTAIAQQGKERS